MKKHWLTAAQWRFLLVALGLYFIVCDVRGLLNWRPALDPAVAGTLGVALAKPGSGYGQQIESLERQLAEARIRLQVAELRLPPQVA